MSVLILGDLKQLLNKRLYNEYKKKYSKVIRGIIVIGTLSLQTKRTFTIIQPNVNKFFEKTNSFHFCINSIACFFCFLHIRNVIVSESLK